MAADLVDPDFQRVTADHQALARQIDVIQSLTEPGATAPGDFLDALNVLAELASAHFAHEEAYMARSGFDGLEAHKQDHQYLLRSLGGLITSVETGAITVSADVGGRLSSWLNFHISRYDEPFRLSIARG